MIALDTNVLVRYLVQDHPAQAAAATKILEAAEKAQEPCFLSDIVLCELVWVLESCYKHRRAQVVSVLNQLQNVTLFEFADADLVAHAVAQYHKGPADFSDYLLINQAHHATARMVYTFDKALRSVDGCTVL